MARKKTKRVDAAGIAPPVVHPLSNPRDAADQIDAILYFIHKRYAGHEGTNVPTLQSFLIFRADVVFTADVTHVVIEKKPELNTLNILTPPVASDLQEERRIFLLSQFGELLIKCQKQAYDQIREMLLRILDAEGKEVLVAEFLDFKQRRQDATS